MRYLLTGALLCIGLAPAFSQSAQASAGTLQHFENVLSQYVTARNVDVWLPADYTPRKRYAVLYLHDGQMLFDSTHNWNHQEWGIDETMDQLLRARQIRDCIVVGIWNNPDLRQREYVPQKAFDYLSAADRQMLLSETNPANGASVWSEGPLSDEYLKFLVLELKPFIDRTFSTKKDRNNTFIGGSSMGGLISMYALCEYPEVFGGAACLSTHWVGIFRLENNPIPAALLAYLNDHLPAPRHHKIYFDHGTATLDAWYGPFQQQADAILRARGYGPKNWITRVFDGEDHTERAWRARMAVPLRFLLGRGKS